MRHKTFLFGKNTFSRLLPAAIAAAGLIFIPAVHADTLTAAGSTFINPIMKRWVAAYKQSSGVDINYQPIGSGGGINALISHTVDFAGSDVPMNASEKSQAAAPVVTVPDILGAVVVGYNIPGVGPGIALSGKVVADIFEGKITSWNDPEITKLSPGVKFPNENILVIHRSDGSGTTAIFTDYLSKVSGSFKSNIGSGKSVRWPVGLGGKGSPGIAGYLKIKPYSIGYVELAYAIDNNIHYASIKNKSGKAIYPSDESVVAAAEGIKIPANLEISVTDSSNPSAYPITGLSYLITYANGGKNEVIKKFFKWILTEGQTSEFTAPDHYSPLSPSLKAKVLQAVEKLK
jgi:phosphate transport system substrate-binding protein